MSEMNEMYENTNWFKRNQELIFSTLLSIVMGCLVGFYMDGFMGIKPTLEKLQNTTTNLSDSIAKYHKEATIYMDFVRNIPETGIGCKLGINDKLSDRTVAIVTDKSHGFVDGDRICLINIDRNDLSIHKTTVFVQLVKDNSQSDADFFVNNKTLNSLNIPNSSRTRQGVFNIYYEKAK